jgi:hypothetical protein
MAIIEAIETVYMEEDTASVTFSSLGSYEHLRVKMVTKSRSGSSNYYDSMNIRFGTGGGAVDTGTNYSIIQMYATGSSSHAAGAGTGQTAIYTAGISDSLKSDAIYYSTNVLDILDYANANKNTTVQSRYSTGTFGSSTTYTMIAGGVWDNTGAVDKFTLLNYSTANFERGSEFTLYGIKSS